MTLLNSGWEQTFEQTLFSVVTPLQTADRTTMKDLKEARDGATQSLPQSRHATRLIFLKDRLRLHLLHRQLLNYFASKNVTVEHPNEPPSANCLDKRMKTLKTALTVVAVFAAMNATSMKAERQPHMQQALEHLRAARAELMAASHDKGGHRMAALDKVNRAIEEVDKGMAFDRQH
jgi:hypothetical protein